MSYELRYSIKLVKSQTITTTDVYTSIGYDLSGTKAKKFAVWIIVESGTNPDVKLTYEMADKDILANYVVPNGTSPLINDLTDTNPRILTIENPPMQWIRFKVTGNDNNGSAIVTVKLTLTS